MTKTQICGVMEEIQSHSDNYRSSSSSASSPTSRVPSNSFFYVRKPGSVRQPISFEDSPEWEDTEIDVRVDEGVESINAATTTASPSLSKINSGSMPTLLLPETPATARKIAGASLVWKDLTVTINGKRKYSDKVVKSSNGYALPGMLTVIMGPAKSGKSTLLRAIAGLHFVICHWSAVASVGFSFEISDYVFHVYLKHKSVIVFALCLFQADCHVMLECMVKCL